MKKHVGVYDSLYALSLGILMSLFFWQEINFKFIPFSVTVFGVMEVFIQFRWRLSLPCQKCGFDPLIYIRSPQLAAEKIRIKFERRLEDPSILDKRLPMMVDKKGYRLKSSNTDGQTPQNKI